MNNSTYPLPDYLRSAKPNPQENRAPWYLNTAPSYAGIFLWIAFYDQLAKGTLSVGGLGAAVIGLIAGGLIAFLLFYLAPAMWGMKTGYPLYIIGTSTFGEKGGYFIPGLFMGVLQVGWYSVGTFFATQYMLNTLYGLESAPGPMHPVFIIAGIVWGYVFAYVGVKGIQYVAKISLFFPIVPLVMLLYAAFTGSGSLSQFDLTKFGVDTPQTGLAVLMMVQLVIGFFATAGAAGADFGMNNRHKNDILLGGLAGVALSIFLCGLLPMIAIAGIMGANPELAKADNAWTFSQAVGQMAGGRLMFLLFAIASMAPACFCSFIIANSFSTMIPSISRMAWTMGGATIGIILAVTGVAQNLPPFFTFIGASFGPVCGAIAADYLVCGGVWPGPRKGINWAGYIAVIVGFIVGILPNISAVNIVPASVYSFVVGFALYFLLSKAGLEPETVPLVREN
ncbi:MAG TPA: amino acid permease [bacterium]|nr:amino acid permease [Candidatus Omnitrophota bacterium]HOL96580.1 amino acid permease [bacterium]HPP02670.1 amino acid permease [bacterium]HXK92899.1 amino acid permease [bacterium]